MDARIINREQLLRFLDKLAREMTLLAPVREDDAVTLFKQVPGSSQIELDYTNSDVPPKLYFFPRSEKMFSFDTSGGGLELKKAEGQAKTVIFGIRPCDLKSILALDPVFSGQFTDDFYASKREKTVLLGLGCLKPQSSCFCTAFDGGPLDGRGADLMFTEAKDIYIVEVMTAKGLSLLENYGEFFSAAGSAGKGPEMAGETVGQFLRNVDLEGVKEVLDRHFELPYWEQIARKCLGCGICTYVCPTCHCFDIFDHVSGGYTGERHRCWDSCMFSDFTLMAGGHNPRPSKKERVRNRFLHKLKYHLDRYGLDGCVGCGRCIVKCPVNIDITAIIKDLKEVGSDG